MNTDDVQTDQHDTACYQYDNIGRLTPGPDFYPVPQGSCLSTLLCSIFLADLESTHLQGLLPGSSWHPSPLTPSPLHHAQSWAQHNHTSSSAARLTDLAQAANTSRGTQHSQPLGH